jgi:hypothetical protein
VDHDYLEITEYLILINLASIPRLTLDLKNSEITCWGFDSCNCASRRLLARRASRRYVSRLQLSFVKIVMQALAILVCHKSCLAIFAKMMEIENRRYGVLLFRRFRQLPPLFSPVLKTSTYLILSGLEVSKHLRLDFLQRTR